MSTDGRTPADANGAGNPDAPLLELRHVGKAFRSGRGRKATSLVALEDFSLTLDGSPPRIVALAGESGSGKTTVANLVLGFLTPTHGEVLYRDGDYFGREVNQAARVVARAGGGEVLVTRPVVEMAAGVDALEFSRIGEVRLKGFSEPTELFTVSASGE